jgi:hypothetical protein
LTLSAITYESPLSPGVLVELELLQTNIVERRAVVEANDYLYTHWHFDVVGRINRMLQPVKVKTGTYTYVPLALNVAGVPAVVDAFGQINTGPAAKDWFVRFFRTPRGRLVYTHDDGNIVLECPAQSSPTDQKGGPIPQSFDILEMTGSEGITARLVVDCFVSECTDPPLILGHKWKDLHDVDGETHLTTRVVEGWATFNVAAMTRAGLLPDFFRGHLVPELPTGFFRKSVRVSPTEDQTGISYVVCDQQMSHGWNRGATWIDAYQTNGVTQPGVDPVSILSIGQHSASQVYGIGANLARSQSLANQVGPTLRAQKMANTAGARAAMGSAIGGGIFLALDWVRYGWQTYPQYYATVDIAVQGNSDSRRRDLENVALSILTTRLGPFFFGGGRGGAKIPSASKALDFRARYEIHVTHDLCSKFVHLTATVASGAGAGVISGYVNDLGIPDAMRMPADETIKDSGGKVLITDEPRDLLTLPYGNGSRGTWLGTAAAQVFKDVCAPPASKGVYVDPESALVRKLRKAGVSEDTLTTLQQQGILSILLGTQVVSAPPVQQGMSTTDLSALDQGGNVGTISTR